MFDFMIHRLRVARPTARTLAIMICIAASLTATSAFAQDAATASPSDSITPSVKDLEKSIDEIDQDTNTEENAKATLKGIYQQAIDATKAAQKAQQQASEYERKISSAEDDLNAAKATLNKPLPPEADLGGDNKLTLEELAKRIEAQETELKQKQDQLNQIAAEPARRATRLVKLTDETRKLDDEIARLSEDAKTAPDAGDPIAVANQMLTAAQLQQKTQELQAAKKEQQFYDATKDLVRAQHDVLSREVDSLSQDTERLRNTINQRRQSEAVKQSQQASDELRDTNPDVRPVADENATLAKHLQEIATKIAESGNQLQQVQQLADNLEVEYQRIQQQVENSGFSEATGRLLRDQRAQLPGVAKWSRSIRARQPESRNVRFEIYTYQGQWSELASMDEAVKRELDQLDVSPTPKIEIEVKDLLENRRAVLQKLVDDHQEYSKLLLNLDIGEQRLIDTARQFRELIDSHVLWIPSAAPISTNDLAPAGDGLAWLTRGKNWRSFATDIVSDVRTKPLVWIAFAAAFLYGFRLQRQLRKEVAALGREAKKRRPTSLVPMARSSLCTLVIASFWPLVLWFIAWRILRSLDASDFSRAMAAAFQVGAITVFPMELFRQICRGDGLADAHFQWPQELLVTLRRSVRGLTFAMVPLVVLLAALQQQSAERLWAASLGRVFFFILMLAVLVTLLRLARFTAGRMDQFGDGPAELWRGRLLRALTLLFVLSPIVLGIAALAGYVETSMALAILLAKSLILFVGVTVASSAIEHWVLINRRRLIQQQRKRQAVITASDSASSGALSTESQLEEEAVDVGQLSEQTRGAVRLLIVVLTIGGLWLIWREVVPALHLLDNVTVPGITSITVEMLLTTVVVLTATYFAARNLPGLLEFLLLRHFPLDGGSRYAVVTLSQYLIAAAGIGFAGQSLGIPWSSLQWLIAAMGIGLGFGLQEIFANFISGIILLFERPLRVGDIVTVDDTIGTVTRIRMRATTIADFDRKEYVVPNKDLITGRFLNWTLSNAMQRVALSVGVAYGSDTVLARKLMLQIADEHPQVLTEPRPYATFEQFGDSSLNLVLRAYLADVDMKLGIVTELNTSIDAAFKQAGIEIAFPQRDLHIRSIDGELRTSRSTQTESNQ